MALSVHKALRLLFSLLIFCDNTVDCSGGYKIHNLMLLQTVPHFQKSGEVFDDPQLKACFELCKEPGTIRRAHLNTFYWAARRQP